MLIASNANPKAVMQAMGHATITMTFGQYGHLFDGSQDEVAERANDYLARHAGGPALRVVRA